jgi:hypothetical protein
MRDEDMHNQRRGMNVAAQAVMLLAASVPAGRFELTPHPRAAALAWAVRDLPSEQTAAGDTWFLLPSPEGTRTAVPLSDIPLPEGTLPIAAVG